ncbi:hypothetical protein SCH01S_45_00130 [Sphingomonas changbaiensis NBRC 104936]|uniref:Ice-binding protein C-terminal domain-containing protein n=1 Tax=Sphingomonas changbaiensis NBRC 104936 TaxID=1219043 RepID=A0A0E9MSR1_9SPHN|nr:hypothetical protein SCH01S_45_00130 [Sphingomonas changbaiensis NBRC 104936]
MTIRSAALAASALLLCSAASVSAQTLKPWYQELEDDAGTFIDSNLNSGTAAGPTFSPGAPVLLSFEGLSDYDVRQFGVGLIPPDTMGAVGPTQFVELINGGFAVYDKATGTKVQSMLDSNFWITKAGGQATGGDPRIRFNAQMGRWIATGFGANGKDIQIGVSDTADATGSWKSTVFEGYSQAGLFRPVADYPTLGFDNNAVYIGTNNFAASTAAGPQTFRGTTLNVIPLADVFAATGPDATNRVKFQNFFNTAGQPDSFAGFAIQGVSKNDGSSTGHIFTVSATDYGVQRYDILNAGTGADTRSAITDLATGSYTGLCGGNICPAHQPSGLRNIDALDDRVSSSVYEVNGKIYGLQEVMKAGTDLDQIRYYVIDSATNAILDQGEITGGGFDYFQGSLAVNSQGQVVISYNRSGGPAKGSDGKVSVMARTFKTTATGHLQQMGNELLIKQSLTDRYLNGNPEASGVPAGRQRWGDYSQVTLDPTDPDKFWLIGQFAREANTPANGHPGGSGFSRWGTWIAEVSFLNAALAPVPEPATWAMMIAGFGMVGFAMRRSQKARVSFV